MKFISNKIVLISLLLLSTSIFANGRHRNNVPDSIQGKLENLKQLPSYVTDIEEIKTKRHATKYKIRLSGVDPQTKKALHITFSYYKNTQNNGKNFSKPVMIVLPTITGETPLERNFAYHYAKNGMHSIILPITDDSTDLKRPITDLGRALGTSVIAVRMIVDFIENRDEIDTDNIGIHGASLGGIIASTAFGIDKRIKTAVIFVAGGDLSDMLTKSDQSLVSNYRDTRMLKDRIYTIGAYKSKLKKLIVADPIFFAHRRGPKNILMITSTGDTKVPAFHQKKLWKAFGMPQKITYPYQHARTILTSSLNDKNQITEFIKKQLDML